MEPTAKRRRPFRSTSPITRRPEVEAFLAASYPTMTARELRDACIARFGEELSPSTSAIYRFIERRRNEAKKGL